eukprot:scaffold104_cov143-Skeletonema_marinoi.AAC.3
MSKCKKGREAREAEGKREERYVRQLCLPSSPAITSSNLDLAPLQPQASASKPASALTSADEECRRLDCLCNGSC